MRVSKQQRRVLDVLDGATYPIPYFDLRTRAMIRHRFAATIDALVQRGLICRVQRRQDYNLRPGDGGHVISDMGYIAARK